MRDAGYRTQEEVNEWKVRDPIKKLRERLIDDGVAVEAELEQIDAEVRVVVDKAAEFAESSPMPDPSSVTGHVYSDGGQHA